MTKKSNLSYRELGENFYNSRSEVDYNLLYLRVKPGLKSYIFNIIKESEATDDVLANTLVKLWTKIDQYNPEYQITTWLYKIAFNECLSYIRKRNRKSSLDSMKDYGVEISEGTNTSSILDSLVQDSSEQMTESELYDEDNELQNEYEIAIQSINNLKPMYRSIMQDRLINNMKYEDISSKHKVSLQTVKNRIRRGKVLVQRIILEKTSI